MTLQDGGNGQKFNSIVDSTVAKAIARFFFPALISALLALLGMVYSGVNSRISDASRDATKAAETVARAVDALRDQAAQTRAELSVLAVTVEANRVRSEDRFEETQKKLDALTAEVRSKLDGPIRRN